jgi:hypothetical protein
MPKSPLDIFLAWWFDSQWTTMRALRNEYRIQETSEKGLNALTVARHY